MTRELKLKERMIAYENGSPARIQHFMKVYAFADMIGEAEKLSEEKMEILRAAALVHDIGIRVAEEKYGSCSGKLQEKEGPAIAEKMPSVESAIWWAITIHIQILTGWITGFWWKQIFW